MILSDYNKGCGQIPGTAGRAGNHNHRLKQKASKFPLYSQARAGPAGSRSLLALLGQVRIQPGLLRAFQLGGGSRSKVTPHHQFNYSARV